MGTMLLLLSIDGWAQGFKAMTVDAAGERVALAGRPSVWSGGKAESRLFRVAEGRWSEAGRFASPAWQTTAFVEQDLLVEGRRQSLAEGALVPNSEPIDPMPGLQAMGEVGPIVHGRQILVGIEGFPHAPLRIIEAEGKGWATVAELEPPPGLPWIISPLHAAFDGQRVAMLLMPLGERCGLLVYEKSTDGWTRSGPLFPEVCGSGEHAGGALALDGEQIAIGVFPYPHPEGRAGEVALHRRGDGSWPESTRVQRPIIEDDCSEDGMRPYAFGHRAQLAGGRLYVGTGYQIIRPHQDGVGTEASVVHNGVMVFTRESGEWTILRNLAYCQPVDRSIQI